MSTVVTSKDDSPGCRINEADIAALAKQVCDNRDAIAAISAPTPPVEPATTIPIPDNETDAAIRTGQAGTSTLYARADHNHPIRRQANPGDPVITVGGNFQLQANVVLDRWSDEESYSYAFRTLVNQPAGTGWGWINIPNIAGFQRPKITGIGSYRPASTAVQEDNGGGAGGDGAGPRGPFMGKEVHHWTSAQRIYGGYFRRDNDFRAYAEYVVEYTRT